ncbi:hypothetical protein [Rudaea sp.]|uniref:hypothetical protein n=1 Tax=Rudaea sp. TaxID=2136325 RepID=UPI0032201BB4
MTRSQGQLNIPRNAPDAGLFAIGLQSMLSRFRQWRNKRREWRSTHDSAWATAIVATSDGLTPFIHATRDQIVARFGGFNFVLSGQSEKFLRATIPGTTADLYLYGEGAQIHDGPKELYFAEHYDYLTPQELSDELVARLIELQPNNS